MAEVPNATIKAADWETLSEMYLQDCELRLFSSSTIISRRGLARNLGWFLRHRGYARCGSAEIRQFFYYLAHGHEESGGRFGNPGLNSPARPITIKDYYIALRCMFDWLVAQGVIERSPFLSIPKPLVRDEMKMPLSQQQLDALLQAAGQSSEPARDTAIVSMLLDTGCRASELVSIRNGDLDMTHRCCRVLGKGNKYRTIFFGERTARTLLNYKPRLTRRSASAVAFQEQQLFVSAKTGNPLQLSGLQQLMKRLRKNGGLRASCSPHALRRAFAVETLKNGANVFSVQAMLGHTDLEMTQRYCFLAQADVEAQHRQFSPMDRLVSACQ